jgi:hypothetical protein
MKFMVETFFSHATNEEVRFEPKSWAIIVQPRSQTTLGAIRSYLNIDLSIFLNQELDDLIQASHTC